MCHTTQDSGSQRSYDDDDNDDEDTIMESRSRRRFCTTTQSEQESTQLLGTTKTTADAASDYSTFSKSRILKQSNEKISPHAQQRDELLSELYKWFAVGVDSSVRSFRSRGSPTKSRLQYLLDQMPWRVVIATIGCVILSLYHIRGRLWYSDFLEPEWMWDHNVYSPRQRPLVMGNTTGLPFNGGLNGVGSHNGRNMLVAQVVGGNAILKSLGEICSRPNRAYARQWGRDYVRFSKPAPNLLRSCFDKVTLLSTIMERQQQQEQQQRTDGGGGVNWMQAPPRVVYDAVALFPPDAIITDLDDDLLNLLPEDKLLAIPGWEGDYSSISNSNLADVLLVNLRHKHAATVVKLWQAMVEPPETCGAGNDLSILLYAVESVLEDGQDLSSVVVSLRENRKGMIASNSIKVIPLQVPGPKAAMLVAAHAESKAILQTTADSVCYRYYPKCEVF